MRVPVLHRHAAALALSALLATASSATADPARTLDRFPTKTPAPPSDSAPSRAALVESLGRLPLQFEVNRGQVDPRVRYLTRGSGSTLFLTDEEAVWVLSRHEKAPGSETKNPHDRRDPNRDRGKRISSVVRMNLEGSRPKPRVDGLDRLPGDVNYFIGNDPKKWRTDVPTFRKVKVANVYAGIDLLYYGNQRQVEYDFVVKPGFDPSVIRVAFSGADRISTDAAGDLVVSTAAGDLRMKAPLVYQERDGQRELVAAAYVLRPGEKRVEFRIAEYDRARELVIDPVIVWSTFLGGGTNALVPAQVGLEYPTAITVGGDGNPIVTGQTNSDDFPMTPGGYQTVDVDSYDLTTFVSKLNPAGTAFVYSTFIASGARRLDVAYGLASDGSGSAYITGYTGGPFPITPGAINHDGAGIFVSKLSPNGSQLVFSARIGAVGAHEWGNGIALGSAGSIYVAGVARSVYFPTTPGAFQDGSHVNYRSLAGFALKLSANGEQLLYSTVLNGNTSDSAAEDVAVDPLGFAYITGYTFASQFPVTGGAFQTVRSGGSDAWVLKLGQSGESLVYSTLLGGSDSDSGNKIEVDSAGNAFVIGSPSASSFPTTSGAFRSTCDGSCDTFVTKVAPDGRSLVYSTYFPQPGAIADAMDVVVDPAGKAIIAGTSWRLTSATTQYSEYDPFISVLSADGSQVLFSHEFGGVGNQGTSSQAMDRANAVALGPGGDAFVAGTTNALTFPITPGVVQPAYGGGGYDSFVARVRFPLPVTATSISPATGPSLGGTPVTITGTGFQTGAVVRLGGIPASVSSVTATSISAVTGPHPDGLVDVEVENPDGGVGRIANGFTYVCSGAAPSAALTGGGTVCAGQNATLSVTLTGGGPWTLVWSDGVTQSGLASSPATRLVTPLSTTTYTVLTVADTTCAGTATGSATVTVNPVPSATLTVPSRVCAGRVSTASIPLTTGATYVWTVTNGAISSGQGSNSLSFVGTSDPVTVAVDATLGTCTASDSRAIPVSVSPSGSVSGGGTICAGGSTNISFDLTGMPPFSITWSDGFVQSVGAAGPGTRSVSPAATRSYTISALNDGTGCPAGSGTGSASVTVNPLPTVTIAAPASFCAGAAGLSASVPDAGAGATYAWTISGGTFGGGTTAPVVSFTPTGPSVTLGVTVGLPTTCSASSSRVVSLAPAPSAVVSGGGTICSGNEGTIQVNLTGTPPYSLTWSDGVVQSGIASSIAQRNVRPTATTTYSVTGVQDASCSGAASGSATFSVVASPSAVMTSSNATICPGGSATLTVRLSGLGPYTLTWSDGFVETVTGPERTRTVSPASTRKYTIGSVRNATCSVPGVGSTLVTVFPDPSASVVTVPAEVCADATGLAASVPDSGAGTVYTWSVTNGTIDAGQGTRSLTWTAGSAGTARLSVAIRVAAGCQVSGSASVPVNARPAMPVIAAPSSIESGATGIVAEVVGGTGPGWAWTIANGTITSGAGTSRITFSTGDPGVVVLDVVEKNAKGCDSPVGHLEIPVKGLTATRLAPIVLDVAGPGGQRYTTELVLSNPSPSPVRVDILYTAASSLNAAGSGTTYEMLPAGRQRVIPDVLAWLRGKGLAIPADGSSQGGALRITFDGVAAGWTPSASSRTTIASGAGRAGLSMPAVDPDTATAAKVWLFGLRETAADRSNVALVNAGVEGNVDLRVSLYSGEGASVPRHVLPTVRLAAGQWLQLNTVLRTAGFASGYALVERIAGTAPFHAYAVFNDNATNDGSAVPSTPVNRVPGPQIVPVVVETGAFTSELVLANPGAATIQARLWFTESLANPGGYSMGGVTIVLAPGEQKILPDILAELRRRGLEIVPANRDYAGTLAVTFSAGGEAADGWAGARTATAGAGAERYGLFCAAQSPKTSTSDGWLFGLLQNADARTNLALVNAAANLGAVTLRYAVYDGATGTKVGTSEPVTLGPGAWTQVNAVLSKWRVENGYVRVERIEGTAPFLAYAVVNDGGIPGKGTGDGSFVEMSTNAP